MIDDYNILRAMDYLYTGKDFKCENENANGISTLSLNKTIGGMWHISINESENNEPMEFRLSKQEALIMLDQMLNQNNCSKIRN